MKRTRLLVRIEELEKLFNFPENAAICSVRQEGSQIEFLLISVDEPKEINTDLVDLTKIGDIFR